MREGEGTIRQIVGRLSLLFPDNNGSIRDRRRAKTDGCQVISRFLATNIFSYVLFLLFLFLQTLCNVIRNFVQLLRAKIERVGENGCVERLVIKIVLTLRELN